MRCDNLFLFAVILGFNSWLTVCNGTIFNSNEKEAKQFALETSDNIFKFYDASRLDINLINDSENQNRSQNILNEAQFLVDIVQKAEKFDFKNFKDQQLKRAFETIVRISDGMTIGAEQFLEIWNSLIELKELESYTSYDCFKKCGGNLSSIGAREVMQLMTTSENPEELEHYWKQVRKTTAEWAKKNMHLLVDGLKKAANLTDESPLDFYFYEYNITEMGNLMSEIQPLYMELHAFIRKSLQQKYGDSIIESDGMIPHHLFEQVLAQTWSNLSIIENLFPFKNLPPIQSVLEKRFKSLELYEIVDRFYQKLGFDEFPYKVWMEDIKMKNTSDDGYCSPYVYYQSPNVHLEYCEKISFEMFLEIYSDMGKLYYAKEMTGLPGYFFNTHGLDEAIGKAAILSTSTYHNLKAIGMIVDFNVTEEVEMNRLLRKSIESLMTLPVKFVHIKLMEGLLSGSLDLKELNTKYWELMKKHVGVKPPMNYVTKPDVPDMPSFFYIDMNWNGHSFSFDMEIMSYQMYKKFCELGEKYPKEPLHLCDMHGTKAVGDLLKKMMRLGNSKPFNETIATMFPEHPGTSSNGILEYYSPVKEFLVKKNSEASVKPGWRQ